MQTSHNAIISVQRWKLRYCRICPESLPWSDPALSSPDKMQTGFNTVCGNWSISQRHGQLMATFCGNGYHYHFSIQVKPLGYLSAGLAQVPHSRTISDLSRQTVVCQFCSEGIFSVLLFCKYPGSYCTEQTGLLS